MMLDWLVPTQKMETDAQAMPWQRMYLETILKTLGLIGEPMYVGSNK